MVDEMHTEDERERRFHMNTSSGELYSGDVHVADFRFA